MITFAQLKPTIKWMANHIEKRRVEEKREEVPTSSSLFSYVNLSSKSFSASLFVDNSRVSQNAGA